MKLNLEILYDYLPKFYRAKLYASEDRKLLYRRPLPYQQGAQMDPHCLYIAMSDAMPQNPPVGAAVICVGGDLPKAWPEVHLLHLEGAADLITAMRDVFAVYDRFELWDQQLRNILDDYDQVNLKAMLVCGVKMLGNRVGITDGSLRQLFFCEYVEDACGMPNVLFRDAADISESFGMAFYEHLKQICPTQRAITVPYLSEIEGAGYDSFCCNVRHADQFIGCIHLDSVNRAFRESDYPLAEHFFGYLKKAFLRYLIGTSVGDSPEIRALNLLLNKKALSREDYTQVILQDDEYWQCFKINGKRGSSCLPMTYMCQVFNLIMSAMVYTTIHEEMIVGLFRFHRKQSEDARATLETFTALLHQMGYIGGVSNAFTDIRHLAQYDRQAGYAYANAACREDSPLCYFRDCVIQYVLDERDEGMPWDSLYAGGLLALIRHDREKGSEYVKTLHTYLSVECNASKAAKLLFIHRSSFLKRLENIQRILALDLQDVDIKLYLRICLRQQMK